MLYREAASYDRGGRHRHARELYTQLVGLSPKGERAARASYELVQLEIQHGDETKGFDMLRRFVTSYPQSGLARRALERYAAYLDRKMGPSAAASYLRSGMDWFHAHSLGETALYQLARRMEEMDQLRQARDTYVLCAKTYPYPDGALFDDALLRASKLDEKLGQPKLAIKHLRQMLSVREPSTFSGSYERPRFSEAQMRIATLYRDALHDHASARREFRRLYEQHTTSILRDDALWAEARVASEDGDEDGACDAVTELVDNLSDSRFAPCAQLLCASAPQVGDKRTCRRYIRRDLEREQAARR
jgi:tetratricopeptide (TPR) repeat protein